VCAAIIAASVVPASAQVPNVQVYFEGNPAFNTFDTIATWCHPPGTTQDIYVVFQNFNMFVQAVDFSIDYPAALFHAAETAPPETLVLGDSDASGGTGGIAIAWYNPQNGYQPLLALTVSVLWTTHCDCYGLFQVLRVRGYMYGSVGNGGKVNPQAVRWPDFEELDGYGLVSYVCPPPYSTEETTWGRVKALYR
jgi:hypothetical protein